MLFVALESLLGESVLGDVIHRQQDHVEIIDAATANYQVPPAESVKILLNFEIRERDAIAKEAVKGILQPREVPPAAAE
jgi:hypothetical protein